MSKRFLIASAMAFSIAGMVAGCANLSTTDYTTVVAGTCLVVNTELDFLGKQPGISAADQASVAKVAGVTVPLCGTLANTVAPTNPQAALKDLTVVLPTLASLYATYHPAPSS